MSSCIFIEKLDGELCRELMCFVADAPESMLMTALREGPSPHWHVGSLKVLESALHLFDAYTSARNVCAAAHVSVTPAQSPQQTPHCHYVTLLYCHMVVARQQGLRSPYCARACVLYAEHLCRLIFLDGGASASVLDGLNAMHYIIHAVGAAAKPRAKQKTPTKTIAVDRDIKTSAGTAASKTSPAAGAGDASDEEIDWSSDDSLGDVDPALLKAAMLAVKMNLGDDNTDREADRQRPAAAAAMPASILAPSPAHVPAAAVAASVIPKFSVLPAKGMQEDTANKYLAEASGVVATVSTVAVGAHSAPSTAVAGNATNPDGDDDAWSSDGSDDSFGDVDPAKLKAAMLAVKMNLGDDNPTAAKVSTSSSAVVSCTPQVESAVVSPGDLPTTSNSLSNAALSKNASENVPSGNTPDDEEVDWSSDDSLGDVDPALLKAAMLAVKMNLGDDNTDREADRQRPAAAAAMPASILAPSPAHVPAAAVAASVIPKFSVLPAKGMQEDTANKYLAEASGVVATVSTVAVGAHSAPSTAVAGNATNPDGDDDAWSSDGSDDSFGDVDPAKLKAAMLAVKMNLGDDNPTAAAKPQRNDSFSQPVPVADCSAPTAAAPRIGAAAPSAPTSSSAGAPNAAAPLAPNR